MVKLLNEEEHNLSNKCLKPFREINENIIENDFHIDLNEKKLHIQELNKNTKDILDDHKVDLQLKNDKIEELKFKLKQSESLNVSLTEDNNRLKE